MDWHLTCPKCGYYGLGRKVVPGSDSTERLLWYALILPGLAYRVWRSRQARVECIRCSPSEAQELAE